ncbi:MAG TPA: gamma-glutamyl-gamma-aminobutyrate hydrolase family protein [Nocardioides sp.]|uniref:gamma-glutamyl-gamma-aminobutyrate hydrolase family protein n=1 Tax=Nocardioides sp. TaxID=35761 RepID=UPI002BB200D6|nr:gamma-glutamyl-gamma-aminobutyrate hydrolase family protein [Nocardioides sp.]HQR26953.1 gamma-glutamyl-gamma-aminobutyrate hydrolase family protein [Nocardioides sp.]
MAAPAPGEAPAEVLLAEVLPTRPTPADPVARVAVLVSLNFPDMTEHTAELVTRFTRVALETLLDLGAAYELFDTSTALPDPAAVAHCDGLLLLGGGDVDGRLYGSAHEEVPNSYGVDLRADRDGIAAVRAALAADLPVLGICRGAQLVNVAYGGTIIPDIDDYGLHRGGPGEPMFLDEEITLAAGTRLHRLLGADLVVGRSGHHQAVDELGEGLVVTARAHDGIVEGFEDPTRWLVGVQWHPEDDDGPEEDRRRLFAGFLDACARR